MPRKDAPHEAHAHYTDWIGHEFDPGHFDLEQVNQRLARLKRRWARRRAGGRRTAKRMP